MYAAHVALLHCEKIAAVVHIGDTEVTQARCDCKLRVEFRPPAMVTYRAMCGVDNTPIRVQA